MTGRFIGIILFYCPLRQLSFASSNTFPLANNEECKTKLQVERVSVCYFFSMLLVTQPAFSPIHQTGDNGPMDLWSQRQNLSWLLMLFANIPSRTTHTYRHGTPSQNPPPNSSSSHRNLPSIDLHFHPSTKRRRRQRRPPACSQKSLARSSIERRERNVFLPSLFGPH